MDHIGIASQSQAHVQVQSKIDEFFGRFKIATLMHQCGVRKHHGHSVRSLTKTVVTLAQHLKVIGMVKKSPKIHYTFNGQFLDIMAIYRRLSKRRGRAKILASTLVMLNDSVAAKLVFVRDRRKKEWLALMSTDTDLSNEDIVRVYGKRWDIEVLCNADKVKIHL